MDVLVLGGSVFLGRAMVAEAQAAGASVTVFNRGRSGLAPDGVEALVGDRTRAADLEVLRGRRFDLVLDTSGYVPADVALAADALAGSVGRYVFVSTISVYPGWPGAPDPGAVGPYAGEPGARAEDVPEQYAADGGPYGWLKAGCELAVQRAIGDDRTTVLRAGCIVGPDDSVVGRLPWWIDRVARGGEVLVPGAPDAAVGLIDARDLARFALAAPAGVFDAAGPSGDTRAGLIGAAVAATGSDARPVYVDDAWLAGQDVEEWTEIPLWVDPVANPSVWWSGEVERSVAAGLQWRPLAETVADTWAWMQSVPGGWTPGARTPGLAPENEQALLAAWRAH